MPEPIRFLHLSDLHVGASNEHLLHEVNTELATRVLLAEAARRVPDPAFVLVTGDLSDDGDPAGYRRVRALLGETFAAGTPLFVGLGNHDTRPGFRAGYLGEEAGDPGRPYFYAADVGGLRVVMLDSSIPGQVGGAIDAGQLAWLDDVLRAPIQLGTIVAVHHPPVRCPVEVLNGIGLANAAELEAVLRDRGVLGVLAGHIHMAHAGAFAETLCSVAPSAVYLFDPSSTAVPRWYVGAGFSVGEVHEGRLTTSTVTFTPGFLATDNDSVRSARPHN
jgi:3',5'-cyclic AMP phosphodiesterase CpdA